MTASVRPTRRSVAKVARLTLVAAAFLGVPFLAATHAGASTAHSSTVERVVPPVDPCAIVVSCLPPLTTIPPVTTIPPDTVPPTLPPAVTIPPIVTVPPVVVDPCIDGCTPPTTQPCDTEGSTVVCPEGDDPDPGHPDPQTPPVVKVDPPIVAHPTFTG